MTDIQRTDHSSRRIIRACALTMVFLLLGLVVFLWLRYAFLQENGGAGGQVNTLQMALYTVGIHRVTTQVAMAFGAYC